MRREGNQQWTELDKKTPECQQNERKEKKRK